MMRFHPIAAMLVAGLVLGAFDAEACTCNWPPEGRAGAKKMLEASEAVFRGRVIRAEPEGGSIRLTFEVLRAWKGPTASFIAVATPAHGEACGIEAEVGSEQIVFANWTTDFDNASTPLTTTVCNGTNPVDYMQHRFPERVAFLEETPDLRQQRALEELHGGGCASCTATGQGLSIVPLLALLRLIRRRAGDSRVASTR